jgi:nitroreductase
LLRPSFFLSAKTVLDVTPDKMHNPFQITSEGIMEFFDLTEARFSARTYTSKDVTEEQIGKILEAIEAAPTSGNHQAYVVAVVRDEGIRQKLAQASGPQGWIAKAPVLMVFFSDLDRHKNAYGEERHGIIPCQDPTIAMAYAQLAATDLGLGTCWVAPFARDSAQEICGLEGNLALTGLLTIGHTTEEKPHRKRRKPDEWTVRM